MLKKSKEKFKYIILDTHTHKYGVHSIVYNLVDFNKSVLDIGCATGYLAKVLKKKNCETWGIDINDKALRIAKNFCGKVLKADANNLSKLKISKKFDYILILDVIEHLVNPEGCLEKAKKFLKSDGKIIVSTPNIAHLSTRLKLLFGKFDYEKTGILDENHIRFFTKKSFINILQKLNFNIEMFEYSVDFGQIPFFGRILDIIDPELQKIFTKLFNSILAVQFIAICTKKRNHYIKKL